MNFLFLFAASLVSGAIGAMGIGGGIVLIPVLTGFFAVGQKDAQFINLVYFVPVAISALWVHVRSGRVLLKKTLIMIVPGVAGAFAGSALAGYIDAGLLRRFFGIFLFAVGVNTLRGSVVRDKKPKKDSMEE